MDEINIEELVGNLTLKDNKRAYSSLKILLEESRKSDKVYAYFDRYAEMMEDENSYIRTRGLRLTAANARWDTENKIDEVIDEYLKHIKDVKPITARQCIQALPEIAKYKPDLLEVIIQALERMDVSQYPDSMRPLVEKDIRAVLKELNV